MAYKIMNNFIDVSSLCKFSLPNRISRNDHAFKVQVPFAKTDYFMNSYFVRTAKDWNATPGDIIQSASLSIFKSSLMEYFLT